MPEVLDAELLRRTELLEQWQQRAADAYAKMRNDTDQIMRSLHAADEEFRKKIQDADMGFNAFHEKISVQANETHSQVQALTKEISSLHVTLQNHGEYLETD